MKLYVPNPQVWVDYFEGVTQGSSNQRGGGRKPGIITVKPAKKKEEQHVTIKAVLPTEQTAAQAKSELEREAINPKEVEKAFQNITKHRRENKKRKVPESTSSSATKRQKRRDKKRREGRVSKTRRGYPKKKPDIFVIA
ncbi:MAG: hypothetical protein JAZ03_24585 [Candidatus Thiodiazotropha taylori]|nr:hypothetical protein [Candidatus Thiodiazotropha taylori]MCW4337112.1 hypothetical protein [Candidatus Thiodiazotropha endolucinida]